MKNVIVVNINISHKWSPSRPHCTEQRSHCLKLGGFGVITKSKSSAHPEAEWLDPITSPEIILKRGRENSTWQTVIAHLCTYWDSWRRPHTTCTWVAQSLEGQMVASMPHGWGRACAQELRGEARLSSSWRGARGKRALGGKERVGSVWSAAQIPAPNPSIPTLLVQKTTLALCLFQENCTAKSHFFALETRDDPSPWTALTSRLGWRHPSPSLLISFVPPPPQSLDS